jgi:hypothetical protein
MRAKRPRALHGTPARFEHPERQTEVEAPLCPSSRRARARPDSGVSKHECWAKAPGASHQFRIAVVPTSLLSFWTGNCELPRISMRA